MDISQIELNEVKRQKLIEKQVGDGKYNYTTGVYKWGKLVYDLTLTNGETGLGWMPMRSKIINKCITQ